MEDFVNEGRRSGDVNRRKELQSTMGIRKEENRTRGSPQLFWAAVK